MYYNCAYSVLFQPTYVQFYVVHNCHYIHSTGSLFNVLDNYLQEVTLPR